MGPNAHRAERGAGQDRTRKANACPADVGVRENDGDQQNGDRLSKRLRTRIRLNAVSSTQKSSPRKSNSSAIGPEMLASKNWLIPGNVPIGWWTAHAIAQTAPAPANPANTLYTQ
jgi:hypothetical protein